MRVGQSDIKLSRDEENFSHELEAKFNLVNLARAVLATEKASSRDEPSIGKGKKFSIPESSLASTLDYVIGTSSGTNEKIS